MIYRTEDLARWGVGKGANLLPAEVDGNFWELAERLVAVEASAGAAANGIASITVTGSQMTVYLDNGTALGPYTLPTAMIRYRGDWTVSTTYSEMDLVAVPDTGIYLVLRDHTSDAAAFDASAEDGGGNPLYRFLFPMGAGASALADLTDVASWLAPAEGDVLTWDGAQWDAYPISVHINDLSGVYNPEGAVTGQVLAFNTTGTGWWEPTDLPAASGASVSDEGTLVLAAPTDINFAGAGVSVTDDGDGTVTVTLGGGAGAIDDLSDVALVAPAAADYLRFDGAAWVDAPLAWADIPDAPAAFPPSDHMHDWSEVTGRPATIDALPAAVGAAGTVLKAQGDGTVAWGTDETSGAGGGSVAVSDEGVQILGAPTDLNFAGAGVMVSADGDGTVTITIPGGGGGAAALGDLSDVAITTPAAGNYLRHDGAAWVDQALAWGDIPDVPATFPPASHTHPSTEISDFAEAVQDTIGALLVAGTNITLTYDDAVGSLTIDAAGGGGGGSVAVSDEGVQVLATPSDLNFAGAGVSVADDGDGTATVIIPGGIADAPANGNLYGRRDGAWATINLPAPEGAFRHWRLRLSSEDQFGSTVRVAELQFREAVGVAEQATGGTATGSFANLPNAFDGDNTTHAEAGSPHTDDWIGYDFGSPKSVAEVAVTSSNNQATTTAPKTFVLEASSDGSTWVEAGNSDGVSWSGFGYQVRTVPIAAPSEPVSWSDVTNYPALIDELPAALGAEGQVLKVASGALVFADDVTGSGSPVEDVTGTAYTAVAADGAKWKRTTDAGGVTVTIDANVHAAGDEITFEQAGAGPITFAAGAGMTLNARGGVLTSAGQFAVCGLKFVSATEATLFGDIA